MKSAVSRQSSAFVLLSIFSAAHLNCSFSAALSPPTEEVINLTPDQIRLVLPDLGSTSYPPGIVRIPEPERIRRLVLHVPRSRVDSATPKLNTFGTGLVQTTRARKDEVLYEIDLSRHEGRFYELGTADNTVEISVTPRRGADPIYASWVIAPPADAGSWRTQDASPEAAKLLDAGLEIVQRFDDGSEAPLEEGITTARRVVVRARLAKSEEAPSLFIRRTAKGVDPWVKSVGVETETSGDRGSRPLRPSRHTQTSGSRMSAEVDLEIGENRIEVEVQDGTRKLYGANYRILRRALTAPSEIVGEKWAVVIGISDYREDGLDLRFAHKDAEALHALLVEHGGFSRERTRLLTNEKATLEGIRTVLNTFLNAAKPEDLAVIFLAGHGVQDPANPDNFYFLAHDSALANLGGTALPMWDLGRVMDSILRTQRIVVLADTCHSGRVVDTAKSAGSSLNFFNKYLEVQAKKKGRLIVTASQAHQSSSEREDLSHGVFTHALLQALQGAADNNPADRVVTASEAFDFVRAAVPEATRGTQHPSVAITEFDMNLPLTRVPRALPKPRN